MNEQIFKICPTLGDYHNLTDHGTPMKEYREFYLQHRLSIDEQAIIYGKISDDRKKLGGDKKIHKI